MTDSHYAATKSHRFWEASAVVWSAVIISLAITPIRNVEMITAPISDKVLHALAFMIGSIVWAGALDSTPGQYRSVGLASLICLGMGGLIELLQSQTATRTAETGDIIADAIGILIGGLIWILFSRRKQRQVSARQPQGASVRV